MSFKLEPLGHLKVLQEAMLSFGAPRDSAVRASSNGCNCFALKITAMMELNRSMPGVEGLMSELMMSCILTEGRRRVKERAMNGFDQKLEAFKGSKETFQASMPLGLRVTGWASDVESRSGSRTSRAASRSVTPTIREALEVIPPSEEVPQLELPHAGRLWDPGGSGGGEGEVKPGWEPEKEAGSRSGCRLPWRRWGLRSQGIDV